MEIAKFGPVSTKESKHEAHGPNPTRAKCSVGMQEHQMMPYTCWLLGVTIFTIATGSRTWKRHELVYYGGILYFMAACWMNVLLASVFVQKVLHEVMVFFILYGHLSFPNVGVRKCAYVLSGVTIASRHIHGRCLFLWWMTDKNLVLDVCHVIIIAAGRFCQLPALVVLLASCLWSFADARWALDDSLASLNFTSACTSC